MTKTDKTMNEKIDAITFEIDLLIQWAKLDHHRVMLMRQAKRILKGCKL